MKLRRLVFVWLPVLGILAAASCSLSTVEDLPSGKGRGPMAPVSGDDGLLPGLDSEPEGAAGGMGGMGGADSSGGSEP